VEVERHEVIVPTNLGTANELRIAFAADFHAGPTTSVAVFERAVQLLADARPDLVLFGGDFVSLRAEYARRLVPLLQHIPAPLGRFAVLGNHDYWTDAGLVREHLRTAGVRVLTNEHVQLPAPFERVALCGLDDHTSGEPDAASAFADPAPVRIVLMHAPSGLLDIGDRPFDVALSGHTHGGQIALWDGCRDAIRLAASRSRAGVCCWSAAVSDAVCCPFASTLRRRSCSVPCAVSVSARVDSGVRPPAAAWLAFLTSLGKYAACPSVTIMPHFLSS
jgi:predicted phosphodiesterase